MFYLRRTKGNHPNTIYGFPAQVGAWCHKLKFDFGIDKYIKSYVRNDVLQKVRDGEKCWSNMGVSDGSGKLVQQLSEESMFTTKLLGQGADINIVQYLGIASDEPERIERHTKKGFLMPLVEIGWTEADAKQWCIENDLLSPIYTDKCMRGGCWFCHNQGIDQLRQLRHNYPDLWKLLLKWDDDSPVSFKTGGITVHNFDMRFQLEDDGLVATDRTFRWKDMKEVQLKLF